MAKKSHFQFHSCIFLILFISVFAVKRVAAFEILSSKIDDCSVPPPDSFRVTDASLTYIALAWQPTWPGASHTLHVQEKNPSGAWAIFRTFTNVLGSSFFVDSLESGISYRFTISTNCASGETSTLRSSVEGETKVLDLILAGRNPSNASVAEDCHNINYLENEWVGFRIDYQGEGILIYNIFEFEKNANFGESVKNGGNSAGWIKRVFYDSGVYAANMLDQYPTYQNPIFPTSSNKFQVGVINNFNFELGGIIYLEINEDNNSVDICPVEYQDWDSRYTFTPLIANSVFRQNSPLNTFREGKESKPGLEGTFIVQNPTTNILNIFNTSKSMLTNVDICLLNSSGEKTLEHHFESFLEHESIHFATIPTGFYLLRIETSTSYQILKVLIHN